MKLSGVLGIGIDLVENRRMRDSLARWGARFKAKVFLPAEQAYCDSRAQPWRHYAGRFAVKEAVSKAFGTGIGAHLDWLDIEVVRDEDTGAPAVRLNGKGARMAQRRGVAAVLASLSHTRTQTIAQAVLVGHPAEGGPSGSAGANILDSQIANRKSEIP
jgi:holo-[acyl-carrier protein] synthase